MSKASNGAGSVRWDGKSFRARCTLQTGRRVNVGSYKTEEEAHAAIREAMARPPPESVLPAGSMRIKEYAESRGLKHGTVKRWIGEGLGGVVRGWRGKAIGVSPAEADAWIEEHRPTSWGRDRKTRVYFVLDERAGEIKIGFSHDIDRRLGELRREGREPRVLATIPGDKQTEQAMHARFAAERIGETEWFRASDRLLRFIAAMAETEAA